MFQAQVPVKIAYLLAYRYWQSRKLSAKKYKRGWVRCQHALGSFAVASRGESNFDTPLRFADQDA